jgi:hypothetical protein
MRNLIIDGAAGGETERRHDVTFPLLTLYYGGWGNAGSNEREFHVD